METTKHYSLRLVAAILSIAIALMSLPLTVFADELGRLFENQETEAVTEKELFEVLEKRTATSKTFRLEDGSFYIGFTSHNTIQIFIIWMRVVHGRRSTIP